MLGTQFQFIMCIGTLEEETQLDTVFHLVLVSFSAMVHILIVPLIDLNLLAPIITLRLLFSYHVVDYPFNSQIQTTEQPPARLEPLNTYCEQSDKHDVEGTEKAEVNSDACKVNSCLKMSQVLSEQGKENVIKHFEIFNKELVWKKTQRFYMRDIGLEQRTNTL